MKKKIITSMLAMLSINVYAQEKFCTGFSESLITKERTSGVLNATIHDSGKSITIDFGKVSYSTSKLIPEKPNGKTFPSGSTKEGNIIQRLTDNHYRFFQMAFREKVDLTCR